MKKIIKYLGEVLTIIGSFITAYNVFNFKHWEPGPLTMFKKEPHYYYSTDTGLFIAIGISLIVIGILIIRNKKSTKI